MIRTLAAVATVPGREAALERALASLRPQVDEIRVVCHDMEPPPCVLQYADQWVSAEDTLGSAAKLMWAEDWHGAYLACDDDIEYPADYALVMRGWLAAWQGRALVTCHGRILREHPSGFQDAHEAAQPFSRNDGFWLNYPGGCALAFDARVLAVPATGYTKSCEEAGLAVWAQRERVPIWLVPHRAGWLRYLLPGTSLPTIWAEEKEGGFARRDGVLAEHADPWRLHTLEGAA